MTEARRPDLETLRQALAPDHAALARVVAGALRPQRRRVPVGRLALVVALLAAAAWSLLGRAEPPAQLAAASLSNRGAVYIERSATGLRIHNNPPAESATFQMLSRGDSP